MPRLRMVCVNDVYTLAHLPRLRSLVHEAATVDPADVLVTTLAGDFVAPSMLSSLDAGRGMVDCMNAVPITHVTFGNHEDDIPTEALRLRVREFQGTWLATNVPSFDPAGTRTCQILAVGRVRVGLVGVVMDDEAAYHRKPFGGVPVLPPNDTARRATEHLVREEGCACVIPLTHQSMADDRALARAQRSPPFPVIVGGHEHVLYLEEVQGTTIVKAGSDAVRAAVVELTWPEEPPPAGVPDLPVVRVRVEELSRYPADPALQAMVERHMRAVEALELATLLRIPPGEVLSSVGTRARQTSMGTLVCSRLRDALGAEACVFNGGGIRGAREYRERFAYGDLEAELPFDNEVVVAKIPGAVLREAVAFSRARAPEESGGFLQVDDRTLLDGSTVVSVDGRPLDEARDYRVALVRNLFQGMDHNEPLVRFARAHPERVPPAGSGREAKLVLVDAFSLALWEELGGFDAIDTNKDGVLSAQEISAAVARATSEPASALTVELLMRALDTDHDRGISREEALAGSARAGGRAAGSDGKVKE